MDVNGSQVTNTKMKSSNVENVHDELQYLKLVEKIIETG